MERDATDYEPNPDDERPVPLDDDEPSPPPTIDPDERVEETANDDPGLDDERVVE